MRAKRWIHGRCNSRLYMANLYCLCWASAMHTNVTECCYGPKNQSKEVSHSLMTNLFHMGMPPSFARALHGVLHINARVKRYLKYKVIVTPATKKTQKWKASNQEIKVAYLDKILKQHKSFPFCPLPTCMFVSVCKSSKQWRAQNVPSRKGYYHSNHHHPQNCTWTLGALNSSSAYSFFIQTDLCWEACTCDNNNYIQRIRSTCQQKAHPE